MAGVWTIVRRPAFWLPLLLAFGLDVLIYEWRFSDHAIVSDGWGYYLQLPAIFVYGDPHLAFLHRPDLAQEVLQYRFPDGSWQGLSVHGEGYLDKYAFGPAVLQLPFFLTALLIAHFRYAVVNGFETPFQIANAISGALYFGLGSFLIYRTCRIRYGAVASGLALAGVILGTNILWYASGDASFSHIYGYCLLAGLVYLTVWHEEHAEAPSLSAFVLFGLLMGLAVMVRPTNAIYALLFIVFARRAPLRELAIRSICAFLASAVAASPQMALWYVTTGQPIYYSYTGEGFSFFAPELRNYLFSIRKGVFFWHPLYLLMILALILGLLRRPLEGALVLLLVVLNLYIGASWSDYTFGHSFGSRQSVELLPVLVVSFAGGIAWLMSTRWKWAAATVMMALIALNVVHLSGYIAQTLPRNYADRVSYAAFWTRTLGWQAAEKAKQP
jgi:hypothetical protein